MSSERRKFRPFDVPVALSSFLDEARLVIGDDEEIFVESTSRRVVSDAELRSGAFGLSITRDDSSFGARLEQAVASANKEYGEGAVGLAVVVGSSYLKLADVVMVRSLDELERVLPLTNGVPARSFGAVFHGADIDAAVVLLEDLDDVELKPSRKGTWLSRARFELRTGLDGAGFNVLPLTDDLRTEHHLPKKTMRWVDLSVSPLELPSTSAVNLYVDSDLLARLNREMSKSWAVAFTDQLAVDVLSAIALRAVADPAIHEKEWTETEETLLGALISMVDGNTGGDEVELARRRQELLDVLRTAPNRFLALVEGAMDMRDNVRRIVGG